MKNIATIDLGSNSFHMLIGRLDKHGVFRTLVRKKQQVQLRAGIDAADQLSPEAEKRALRCLQRFARYLKKYHVEHAKIVGTYTLRKVNRVGHFLAEAEAILGFPVNVISGEEEARLIYVGATWHDMFAEKRLIVDIGGGSTELIIGEHRKIHCLHSLGMGCVSFQNQFFADGVLVPQCFDQAIQAAKQKLQRVKARYESVGWQAALGSSGTVVSICNILTAANWPPKTIDRAGLQFITEHLLAALRVKKIHLKGLRSDRQAILAGGLCILIAIFEVFALDQMRLSSGGVREGMLCELIEAAS